jgi:hypothetical protein
LREFAGVKNKEALRRLYSESVGRGQWTSECFRAYEAVTNGAIPVIVEKEPSRTHLYGSLGRFEDCVDQLPPFLFADSWEEAARLCQN